VGKRRTNLSAFIVKRMQLNQLIAWDGNGVARCREPFYTLAMPINRRRFLALSAVASLAPSAVVVANTRREYMVQVNGCAVNAETPLDHEWILSVDGDAATAMQLTLTDLRAVPVTEVTCGGVKATAKQLHGLGSEDPPKSVPPFHLSAPLRLVAAVGPRPVGY